jgi:hypothetical protein
MGKSAEVRLAEEFQILQAKYEQALEIGQTFQRQHNELYAAMVGMLKQLGGEYLLELSTIQGTLHFSEYLIETEDMPELEAIRYKVRHISEQV